MISGFPMKLRIDRKIKRRYNMLNLTERFDLTESANPNSDKRISMLIRPCFWHGLFI